MQALWRDIYLASGGAKHRDQARRIANLSLAIYFQADSEALSKSSFFARLTEIGGVLGGPITVGTKLTEWIWRRLRRERPEPPTREQIDHWIEAFQSADDARKSLGAYATPAPFGNVLARETLGPLLISGAKVRIVDPAAGAGSLLLAAYHSMVDAGYAPRASLHSLHGVELDPAARELCVLLLWTSAGPHGGHIQQIAANIRLANAITFDWRTLGPFDALLMNPPWESLRHTRTDPNQAKVRADTLARIGRSELGADGLPPLYTAQGRGDRNLFKLFVELAPHLLRRGGRYGAVLPAAFGSDDGMTALRQFTLANLSLEKWTTFENRGKYFQIDSRYKFGLISGTRSAAGTKSLAVLSFCKHPHEVEATHVRLGQDDLLTLGGRNQMIPELVTPLERDVIGQMLVGGTPLFEGGHLGTVKYRREIDLTLGRKAGYFWHIDEARKPPHSTAAQLSFEDTDTVVPVLEGRMIGQYDCFQKSWVSGSGRSARWEANGDRSFDACRPQFVTHPKRIAQARVAICDVTSATNTRTVLAALVPPTWICGNTAPVLVFETLEYALAGLAILNSMVFDWSARRMVGGLHLNKFYLARLTWPRLTPAETSRLAELGRTVSASGLRGAVPSAGPATSNTVVAALAEIEIITARGYGLDRAALTAMFDPDRSDRRGLWRYFASSPVGRDAAALAIAGLPQSSKETIAA